MLILDVMAQITEPFGNPLQAFFDKVGARDIREGWPMDCCNWGKWVLLEYILKGPFLGLVVPVQYIFVLPCLGCSSRPNTKYYFPHRTVFHRVRRSSVECGVIQLVVRRLAVRQARVRFSARHSKVVFSTVLTCDEEMKRNFDDWDEWDAMNLCFKTSK
jgi:hypothetical protein